MSNVKRPRTGNILLQDDTLITNKTEILDAWKNYFEKLVNTNTVENTQMVTNHTADIQVEMPKLTKSCVRVGTSTSKSFQIRSGLKLEDVMTPQRCCSTLS